MEHICITKYMHTDKIMKLCETINMPAPAVLEMLDVIPRYDFTSLSVEFERLLNIETAGEAFKEINDKLADNPDKGYIWLAISMAGALVRQEICHTMGISDEVFCETMKCFSRFVCEHKATYGKYGFDRQAWSYRQLCGVLYRIGTLEFEMVNYTGETLQNDDGFTLSNGEPMVSIHIPSDADIDSKSNHESYAQGFEFIQKFYPKYRYSAFYCSSWLMSPNLKQVLGEGSKILQFQSDYEILQVDENNMGYVVWVYKDAELTPKDYPENTSLQRNIKTHINNGGKVGSATGIIRKENICCLKEKL